MCSIWAFSEPFSSTTSSTSAPSGTKTLPWRNSSSRVKPSGTYTFDPGTKMGTLAKYESSSVGECVGIYLTDQPAK